MITEVPPQMPNEGFYSSDSLVGPGGAASGCGFLLPVPSRVEFGFTIESPLSQLVAELRRSAQNTAAVITASQRAAEEIGATIAEMQAHGQRTAAAIIEMLRPAPLTSLFEFLTDKLSAFAEAGVRGQESYTTQVSNLSDALQQLKGIATQDLFPVIVSGLRQVNGLLADPTTAEKARGIGAVLTDWSTKLATAADRATRFGAAFAKIPLTLPWLMGKPGGGDVFDAGAAQQFIDVAQRARAVLMDQVAHATTLKEQAEALIAIEKERVVLIGRVGDKNQAISQEASTQLGLLRELSDAFAGMAGSAAAAAGARQRMRSNGR